MDNIKSVFLDYLKQSRIMVLATLSETGPWATPVFYAIDDEFNIYFMSAKDAKHVSDIEKNNKVALAVAGTNQVLYAEKIGAQITGRAEKIDPKSQEYKKGVELLLTAVWGYGEEKLLELDTVKSMTGLLFKVKTDQAKFFNEKMFEDHLAREVAI